MEILTAEQMALADKKTIAGGIKEIDLIRNAGQAMAKEIINSESEALKPRGNNRESSGNQANIVVVCGAGNNGADGLVCAQHLSKYNYKVTVICALSKSKLTGERKVLAQELEQIQDSNSSKSNKDKILYQPDLAKVKSLLKSANIIVDALFGTGLSRAVQGYMADIISAINNSAAYKIAADIPSGLSADLASPIDDDTKNNSATNFVKADMTISFFRPKLCHYLYPAAAYCGEIKLVQIGIKDRILKEEGLRCKYFVNIPALWQLPDGEEQKDDYKQHKYSRGHALIVAGNNLPGAGVLAASAASNSGAGLVTIHSYRGQEQMLRSLAPPNVMVRSNVQPSPDMLADNVESSAKEYKASAALIGPGQGVNHKSAALTIQLLQQSLKVVLDADVFSSFANNRELLLQATRAHYEQYQQWAIMTPHEGEFMRIFGKSNELNNGKNKIERAVAAADEAQAIILLKGADSVIALPDGQAIVNKYSICRLAIGGSGDVLAGLITGLLAQGMPPSQAACAAVWIHSQAAASFQHNFTPQELATQIKYVLQDLSRAK